jgi:two-component system OmpR family response regulator
MSKILLVEEDVDLANSILVWCKSQHQDVEHVVDGLDALNLICNGSYEAVILDCDLQGLTGIDLCGRLRKDGNVVPLILLSGKGGVEQRITALDAGADDVLGKPFNLRELSSRLRALVRRASGVASSVFRAHDLELDTVSHRVLKGGSVVQLMPREFAMLEFLLRNKNQIFSAETLLQRLWHTDSESSPEAVRACIKRLRRKIDEGVSEDNSIIETVPKVGYRLRV